MSIHPPVNDLNRALVLVDGEHYPPAVADAICELADSGWKVQAAVLVGGGEKLRGAPEYGVPLATGDGVIDAVRTGCDTYPADVVIDLADEPVLVFERRLRVIAEVVGRGMSWLGAETRIDPPSYERITAPALGIIGTGKRIGKTAISAHIARLAQSDLSAGSDAAGAVIVVAMGRGGPAQPVVIDAAAGPVTAQRLLEISRAGSHAASDYLEDAALTGLTTVGCRRVGGGLLGVPVTSNVGEGARIAASRDPRLVILEGSGSCIPPVVCDRTLLVASTDRPRDLFDDLGPYRLARADFVMVVGEDEVVAADMVARVQREHPTIRAEAVRLTPTPVTSVAGRRVAVFSTAPPSVAAIIERRMTHLGATPVLVSCALARREELTADVERAIAAGVDALVVEIKAAGIDVVAEAADAHGIDVIFLDNPPTAHDGELDLDRALVELVRAAATPR